MSFKSKASLLFPNAVWTGGSSIHVSVYRDYLIPLQMSEARPLMSAIVHNNFPAYIYRTIIGNCPDMEWLMSVDDFNNLVLVDCYRLLHGMGTVATDKRLKNPKTGNLFHRITLLEESDIVGGFRVWLVSDSSYGTNIGFRFRLEEQTVASTILRTKAHELATSLDTEMDLITEYVSKEPVNAEVSKLFNDFI